MKVVQSNVFLLLIIGLLMTGVESVFAQNNAQRQRQMDQNMTQMQQTMQRMDGIMQRTNQMSQNMNQYMERASGEQLRNQMRTTMRMSEELGVMAGTIRDNAERCQLMLQDREMVRDRDMKRDMERLQNQMREMSGQVEDAVKTMERVTERLQHRVDGGTN